MPRQLEEPADRCECGNEWSVIVRPTGDAWLATCLECGASWLLADLALPPAPPAGEAQRAVRLQASVFLYGLWVLVFLAAVGAGIAALSAVWKVIRSLSDPAEALGAVFMLVLIVELAIIFVIHRCGERLTHLAAAAAGETPSLRPSTGKDNRFLQQVLLTAVAAVVLEVVMLLHKLAAGESSKLAWPVVIAAAAAVGGASLLAFVFLRYGSQAAGITVLPPRPVDRLDRRGR